MRTDDGSATTRRLIARLGVLEVPSSFDDELPDAERKHISGRERLRPVVVLRFHHYLVLTGAVGVLEALFA